MPHWLYVCQVSEAHRREKLPCLGAHLRGRTTIVASKEGSEKVLRRLTGPLNRLNAILSLLHPSTAIGPLCNRECDREGLSRPISHPRTRRSAQNRLVLNHTGKFKRAIVVL